MSNPPKPDLQLGPESLAAAGRAMDRRQLKPHEKEWVLLRLQGCTCPPPWRSKEEQAAWILAMDLEACRIHEEKTDE